MTAAVFGDVWRGKLFANNAKLTNVAGRANDNEHYTYAIAP